MTKKILILLVVLAAPLAMVATATAGPPCLRNPTHPDCVAPPPPSTTTTVPAQETTCAAATQLPHRPFEATDGFTVDLGPRESLCVDWTTTFDSFWSVTFEPATAGGVFMQVADSPYGPCEMRCWDADLPRGTTGTTIFWEAMPATDGDGGPLPASGLSACGDQPDTAPSYVLVVSPTGGRPTPLAVTVTPIATPPG
jgi:hypothetical protein